MKKSLFTLIVVLLFLAACAPAAGQAADAPADTVLLVKVGDTQMSFSAEELGLLPASEANFKGVAYKGVTISALLEAVSVDPNSVKALKAVASDGFAVNYDPAQVLKENVLVAYALADGSPMSAEDGSFRMVLPDEEGKLNPRMLAELQIIQ
jgi:hypothetical protein